ncbi:MULTISPECIES: hypothetical protein [Sulfurimonas]|nr:hypothetical protein [Sulfurimonas indica]
MHKTLSLLTLSTLLISSTTLFADKPVWAGISGKPSEYENVNT